MISNFIKVNIIIVLTVLSYLLALLFEYGYATVFNFPFDMISIDIKSLFVSVFSVSVSIAFVCSFIYVIIISISEIKFLFRVIILFSLMLASYLIWISPQSLFRYLSLFVLFFILGMMISVGFSQWLAGKHAQKLYVKKYKSLSRNKDISFFIFIKELSNTKMIVVMILLLLFYLAWGSFSTARMLASFSTTFYTFEFKGNKYAIIKKYDSNLITAKVTDKKLARVVTYFTTDSLNGLALSYEEGITREGTSESKNNVKAGG